MFNQGPHIELWSSTDPENQCWWKMQSRASLDLWPEVSLFFGLGGHKGAATTKCSPHRDIPLRISSLLIHCFFFFCPKIVLSESMSFSPSVLSSESMECEHFLLVKVTSLLQHVMCVDTHFTVTSYQPVVFMRSRWGRCCHTRFPSSVCTRKWALKMRSFEMQSLAAVIVLYTPFNHMHYPEVMKSIKLPIHTSGEIRAQLISGLVIIAIELTWPSVWLTSHNRSTQLTEEMQADNEI